MARILIMFVTEILLIPFSGALLPTIGKGHGNHLNLEWQKAVAAIIEKSTQSYCSVILVTDGVSTLPSISKKSEDLWFTRSVTVIEISMVSDHNHKNFTTDDPLAKVIESANKVRLASWCVTIVVYSSDLAFLEIFAIWSDKMGFIEWETQVLLATSLPNREIEGLLDNHWNFKMMNTLSINLDPHSQQMRYDIYSNLPYTENGSKVVKLSSWTESRGFSGNSGYQLFPEKFNDFFGSQMNMTVFPFSPYWMKVERIDSQGRLKEVLTGRDYIMLEAMAEAMNFSINVLPDADWAEVIKRMDDRIAFLSPVKLAIMPHLRELYDFTTFIERATLGFSMAKPTLKPRWQSLYYPLRDQVWLSILAVLSLVPVALYVVTRHTYTESRWSSQQLTPGYVLLEVIASLFNQTLSKNWPATMPARLLLGVWLFSAVIIGTAYRGNLTAFLTIPKYPNRPETIKEMIGVGTTVTMPPDLVDFYNSFKKSNSELYQTLVKRTTFVPDFKVGMQQSINQNAAHVYERFFLDLMIIEHFTKADSSTPLYVAKENIMPGYCGWPMIKNAPFKHVMDKHIMSFHEAGLIGKWSSDILKEAKLDSSKKKLAQGVVEEEEAVDEKNAKNILIMALTLTHMQGPIFLLLIGLLLSSMTFFVEIISHRCNRKI